MVPLQRCNLVLIMLMLEKMIKWLVKEQNFFFFKLFYEIFIKFVFLMTGSLWLLPKPIPDSNHMVLYNLDLWATSALLSLDSPLVVVCHT